MENLENLLKTEEEQRDYFNRHFYGISKILGIPDSEAEKIKPNLILLTDMLEFIKFAEKTPEYNRKKKKESSCDYDRHLKNAKEKMKFASEVLPDNFVMEYLDHVEKSTIADIEVDKFLNKASNLITTFEKGNSLCKSCYTQKENTIIIGFENPNSYGETIDEEIGHALRAHLKRSKHSDSYATNVAKYAPEKYIINTSEFFGFLSRDFKKILDRGTKYENLFLDEKEDEFEANIKKFELACKKERKEMHKLCAGSQKIENKKKILIEAANNFIQHLINVYKSSKITGQEIGELHFLHHNFYNKIINTVKSSKTHYETLRTNHIELDILETNPILQLYNICDNVLDMTKNWKVDNWHIDSKSICQVIDAYVNFRRKIKKSAEVLESLRLKKENENELKDIVNHLPYIAAQDCLKKYGSITELLKVEPNLFKRSPDYIVNTYILPSFRKRKWLMNLNEEKFLGKSTVKNQ